mgnify:CR=1 FL=1
MMASRECHASGNSVLLESVALLRSRLGWDVTQQFLTAPPAVRIRWVDGEQHASAVDQFDRDVEREGFPLYRAAAP